MVDTVEKNQTCGIKTNFKSPSRMQRTGKVTKRDKMDRYRGQGPEMKSADYAYF